MAKIKNLVIYKSKDVNLQALAEEYRWIGREAFISKDEQQNEKLTVLALPTKSKRKTKIENRRRSLKESEEYDYEY